MLEFPQTKQQTEELFVYERELIRMANFVIFSAKYLQKVVQKRIDFDFHSIVLNNAIHIPKYSAHHDKTNVSQIIDELIKNGKRNIVYIGAISEWFDYDVIKKTAEKNPAVVFHLFGPVDVDFPPVKNIIFWGKLKHDDIFPVMEVSDALIMPFKLNKLILSVNPIKLYEYIYSGKAVIAIRYDETRYFEDFVYLYEAGDENSLLEMVTLLEKNGYAAKKSIAECREFAEANTWEKRILELKTYIDSALYI
ncbi:hypothetical protein FACS1894147_04870 [Spirochaetia bacterium]|nr:hypothetical protein FACS1894147_04870 [Spirochaetia bacterium]